MLRRSNIGRAIFFAGIFIMTLNTLSRGAVTAAIALAATMAAGLTGAAHAASPPTYTIQWLPDLAGGAVNSFATGINDAGQVTGFSNATGGNHGFFWDPTAGMTDIGGLTGGGDSLGRDINNSGQITGDADVTGTGRHAFVWSAAGGMVDLGTLPASSNDRSVGHGINNLGQVVGTSTDAHGEHAFLWDAINGMQDLGGFLPGNGNSQGYDINDAGEVVGTAFNGTAWHGFKRTAAGVMIDLGDPAGGTDSSFAAAINASGQVAGYGRATAGITALVWDAAGVMQDLGTLGGNYSVTNDISDTGQVIGSSRDASATVQPFVWDALWGMHDLHSLLPAGFVGVLSQLQAINASGQIVGQGTDESGASLAFVLTPTTVPVPGALALMLGGLGALGAASRRRKTASAG
jgi:probable HAF family extracellular repeat protein